MAPELQAAFDKWEASFDALCRYLLDTASGVSEPATVSSDTAGSGTEPATASSDTTQLILASAGLASSSPSCLLPGSAPTPFTMPQDASPTLSLRVFVALELDFKTPTRYSIKCSNGLDMPAFWLGATSNIEIERQVLRPAPWPSFRVNHAVGHEIRPKSWPPFDCSHEGAHLKHAGPLPQATYVMTYFYGDLTSLRESWRYLQSVQPKPCTDETVAFWISQAPRAISVPSQQEMQLMGCNDKLNRVQALHFYGGLTGLHSISYMVQSWLESFAISKSRACSRGNKYMVAVTSLACSIGELTCSDHKRGVQSNAVESKEFKSNNYLSFGIHLVGSLLILIELEQCTGTSSYGINAVMRVAIDPGLLESYMVVSGKGDAVLTWRSIGPSGDATHSSVVSWCVASRQWIIPWLEDRIRSPATRSSLQEKQIASSSENVVTTQPLDTDGTECLGALLHTMQSIDQLADTMFDEIEPQLAVHWKKFVVHGKAIVVCNITMPAMAPSQPSTERPQVAITAFILVSVGCDGEAAPHWTIPWDPGGCLLGAGTMDDVESSVRCKQACFLGGRGIMVLAAFIDHDYYLDDTPSFDLIQVHLNIDCYREGYHRDSSSTKERQVSWDPGGIRQHRLGVKPNFKEGGLLATLVLTVEPWAGIIGTGPTSKPGKPATTNTRRRGSSRSSERIRRNRRRLSLSPTLALIPRIPISCCPL